MQLPMIHEISVDAVIIGIVAAAQRVVSCEYSTVSNKEFEGDHEILVCDSLIKYSGVNPNYSQYIVCCDEVCDATRFVKF